MNNRVYEMFVETLELWLRDNDVMLSDVEWFDLLDRLSECERQLMEGVDG